MIAGSVESLLEKHPSQEAFQTMVREVIGLPLDRSQTIGADTIYSAQLLEHWKGLPVYNRIKKTKIALEPRVRLLVDSDFYCTVTTDIFIRLLERYVKKHLMTHNVKIDCET